MGLLSIRAGRARLSASAAAAQRARELRAKGRDIVELAQGEPDFNTPDHVIEAAYRAMRAGQMHYAPAEMFSGLNSRPFSRRNLPMIAALSSGVPSTGV